MQLPVCVSHTNYKRNYENMICKYKQKYLLMLQLVFIQYFELKVFEPSDHYVLIKSWKQKIIQTTHNKAIAASSKNVVL